MHHTTLLSLDPTPLFNLFLFCPSLSLSPSLTAFPHCRLYFSNVGCIYPMLGLGGRADIWLSINNVSCGKSQLICVRLSPSVALPEYTDRKLHSDKVHTSQHYQAACIANEDLLWCN